jgi:nitrite reductase/ring-hydroxylating ferredoxin subunit
MGNLVRQYWLPMMKSDEAPVPDGPPIRIKLLGEELIAFRATSNSIGLIQNACPHRGASLFFGRNEEAGLGCVYHGWKFDVSRAGKFSVRGMSPPGVDHPEVYRQKSGGVILPRSADWWDANARDPRAVSCGCAESVSLPNRKPAMGTARDTRCARSPGPLSGPSTLQELQDVQTGGRVG